MRGSFVVGLTITGIKMLKLYPQNVIPEKLQEDVATKSMPIGAREGDFVTVVFDGFQAATMIMEVPSFEEHDSRSTHLGLGVVLYESDNPTMYRQMLQQIISTLQSTAKNGHFVYDHVKKIPKILVESFKRPRFHVRLLNGKSLTLELNVTMTEGQRIREALKNL